MILEPERKRYPVLPQCGGTSVTDAATGPGSGPPALEGGTFNPDGDRVQRGCTARREGGRATQLDGPGRGFNLLSREALAAASILHARVVMARGNENRLLRTALKRYPVGAGSSAIALVGAKPPTAGPRNGADPK